jgi:tetratricopeptide (TPR) repeat protein
MTSFTVKVWAGGRMLALAAFCAGSTALLLSGARAAENAPPAALRPLLERVTKAANKDRVVHEMELGVAAFSLGEIDIARHAFDSALRLIEVTHAGTEQARKARSLWYEEGTKEFKGEPYERAMAYYYRGLIYFQDGDFDNARASFNAGILQDAFAEEEQNRCDFAVLYLLGAYACHLQNDAAGRDEFFTNFKGFRPDFPAPEWDNALLAIVETGRGPRKLADGVGHYQMKIFRGKGFKDVGAQFVAGTQEWRAYPAEDIAFQAMTRGSRPIDAILEGKVQFKKNAENIGTTLTAMSSEIMVAAPIFSQSNNVSAVAGGIGLLGVASALVAQNAKPRADTRYWSNLPDSVHVAFLPKTVRGSSVEVAFLDADGNAVARQQRAVGADDTLVWFKNKN